MVVCAMLCSKPDYNVWKYSMAPAERSPSSALVFLRHPGAQGMVVSHRMSHRQALSAIWKTLRRRPWREETMDVEELENSRRGGGCRSKKRTIMKPRTLQSAKCKLAWSCNLWAVVRHFQFPHLTQCCEPRRVATRASGMVAADTEI